MQYLSTRGGMKAASFSSILLEGLAPDGGLVVPNIYPKYDIRKWVKKTNIGYLDLAKDIILNFAPEIPSEELSAILNNAYNTEKFQSSVIAPLNMLDDSLAVLELSNGPTYAFKDIAMQLLGELFSRQLNLEDKYLNILGATSGDTGSSAEYAMRGRDRIKVFMLSPKDRMSEFQKAQMYTLTDNNIHNIVVDGVFDQCQQIVKNLAEDLDFKKSTNLGMVNSINWARICGQIVYFFYGFLQAKNCGWVDKKISFVVPTGNFGNVLAGHIARQMGLPIYRLIIATNENNILEECINCGIYRPRPAQNVFNTSSPSMDIAAASNFERYVFDLCDRDPTYHNQVWQELKINGCIDFKANGMYKKIIEKNSPYSLFAGKSDHKQRIKTIRFLWNKFQRLIDPHTADGFSVGMNIMEKDEKIIVLETAKPIKFTETIKEALGFKTQMPKKIANLVNLDQKFVSMKANIKDIKTYMENNI